MAIELTDTAVAEIRKQKAQRGTPEAALRVGIRGGGCTGFSYLFEWSDGAPKDKDQVFEKDGVKVFVDLKSFLFLDGSTIDYKEEGLMQRGFTFLNPKSSGTCGCGESFAV